MKRTSDHQLTKDNAEQADAASDEPQQGFQRASPEVMSKRRILKARRTPNIAATVTPPPNPFATLAKPSHPVPPKPAHLEPPAKKPKPAEPAEPSAEKPKPAVPSTENPVETPEKPPAEPALQTTEQDSEKAVEEPEGEKPAERPVETTPEKPVERPVETPVEPAPESKPPSGDANDTTPPEPKPVPSPESSINAPTETPSTQPSDTPTKQSTPTPSLSAPQPTPAPLKSTTSPANGTPKPAIIFGATTKPITFASAAQSEGFNFKSAEAPPKVEEKKPEFKEATVLTGEENDKELFRTRAKLYTLQTSENGARWKESGVGALKLNKNTETGKARLLMRTEATLRVLLNTPVFKEFQTDRATDKSIRFQGFDADDAKKSTSFLARFTTKDATSDMVDAVEKCKKDLD